MIFSKRKKKESDNTIQILFVSSTCSPRKYEEVQRTRTKKGIDPSQRLFSAFLTGLFEQDCAVCCLTALPYSTSNTRKRIFRHTEEIIGNVTYKYLGFLNLKIIRILSLYFNTLIATLGWIRKTKNSPRIVICDSLVYMCAHPARLIARLFGIKSVAYVTDYPSLATSIKKDCDFVRRKFQKLFDYLADRDLKSYDGYILVAEKLQDLIQRSEKPSLVVEDMIIAPVKQVEEITERPAGPKKIVYGGSLCKRFGVDKMVDAVHRIPQNDIVLELYGSGESVVYIESIAKLDPRIRYGGVVPFGTLLEIFEEADLLINPRPGNEVFAAYSFPSKTLSYMLSGTPVLTTRIPGIPQDYYPFLYLFDEEDVESMSDRIRDVLSLDAVLLKNKGEEAYRYVAMNKNCRVQAEKIYHFVRKL